MALRSNGWTGVFRGRGSALVKTCVKLPQHTHHCLVRWLVWGRCDNPPFKTIDTPPRCFGLIEKGHVEVTLYLELFARMSMTSMKTLMGDTEKQLVGGSVDTYVDRHSSLGKLSYLVRRKLRFNLDYFFVLSSYATIPTKGR